VNRSIIHLSIAEENERDREKERKKRERAKKKSLRVSREYTAVTLCSSNNH
jgi:hypothetical protein